MIVKAINKIQIFFPSFIGVFTSRVETSKVISSLNNVESIYMQAYLTIVTYFHKQTFTQKIHT